VAVNQLIKHWGDLTDAFSAAWSGGTADQLKLLRERAEQAAEAYDKLSKAKTEWETKGAGAANQAIANEGGDKIRKQIADALIAGGHIQREEIPRATGEITDALHPTIESVTAKGKAKGLNEVQIAKQIAEYERAQTYKKAVKKAEEIEGGLSGDPEQAKAARDYVKRLIKEAPGNFSDEFKKKFAEADPVDIKRQEDAKKVGDALRKSDEAADKAKDEDVKRQRKLVEDNVKANKEDRADTQRKKIQTMEDEKQSLEETRKRINKEMHEMPRQAAQFGSTQEYLKALSSQEMQKIPKAQLEKLEAIDKGIKAVEEAIKQTKREGKFGP
jgi:hypothetical protein